MPSFCKRASISARVVLSVGDTCERVYSDIFQYLRFEEMEQVAERQQVSAAAGREVGRDKAVIQRAESGFVRVRRPGQQGFQLLHHGQLRRTVAAGDQVGIRAVGNDRQQRPAAGLIEAVSCGQPFFQRGQTKLQHGGKPASTCPRTPVMPYCT